MNIYENIKKLEHTNAHGEINFYRIVEGVLDTTGFVKMSDKTPTGNYIVGHSESGHHHVLEREGVEITEFVNDGMKMFHAIVKKQPRLYQDAGAPHAEQVIEPGEYIIVGSIEYDPFTRQARRAAD